MRTAKIEIPYFVTRTFTVLFIALIFTAADCMARSGVSSRFDGTYEGAMVPNPVLSHAGCRAMTVDEFVVRGGHIRPPAKIARETERATFTGFVTEEGFVSGQVTYGAGARRPFEGRMVREEHGVMLSGGVMDEAGCAFLVELRQIPNFSRLD